MLPLRIDNPHYGDLRLEPEHQGGFAQRRMVVGAQPVMDIGITCDTCHFYFRRVGHHELGPIDARRAVERGEHLTAQDLDPLLRSLGHGRYSVFVHDAVPVRIRSGEEDDYFATDALEAWGGVVHDPGTHYYGLSRRSVPDGDQVEGFRLVNLAVPLQGIGKERAARATLRLEEEDATPTAITLAALDVKEPGVGAERVLAEYILDGHHEIAAAAKAQIPVRLITILSHRGSHVSWGLEFDEAIDYVIEQLAIPASW